MPRRSVNTSQAVQSRTPSAARAPEAPAVRVETRSGRTVTVACKLGIARFELQLCGKKMVTEQTQTGPREVPMYFKTGQVWVVRGTAYPEGTPPKGFIKRPDEVDGYALTPGIPADFWREWLEQNKNAEIVKNNLIFAFEDREDIAAMASDFTDVKCALSPLDMPVRDGDTPDTRVPRPMNDGISGIQRLSATE